MPHQVLTSMRTHESSKVGVSRHEAKQEPTMAIARSAIIILSEGTYLGLQPNWCFGDLPLIHTDMTRLLEPGLDRLVPVLSPNRTSGSVGVLFPRFYIHFFYHFPYDATAGPCAHHHLERWTFAHICAVSGTLDKSGQRAQMVFYPVRHSSRLSSKSAGISLISACISASAKEC